MIRLAIKLLRWLEYRQWRKDSRAAMLRRALQ